MKLIDLLVKELPNHGGWPEVAVCATQDKDGEVFFSKGAIPKFGLVAWHDGEWCVNGSKFSTITATDYDTSIITRTQYEGALAASEGWIEWGGGECPVEEGTLVDVIFRDGDDDKNIEAIDLLWNHENWSADITAYRLHKPDINSRADDDRLEKNLNECIGQDVDVVNHPSHYTRGSVECIDAIASATVGKSGIEAVCVANSIKYLWRYEEKGGLESVRKAQWYLNRLIEELSADVQNKTRR